MESPFPGMDPYIETSRIWSDFHSDLAGEIRAELNRSIRPNYFAALTPYVTYDTVEITHTQSHGMYPDVGVWQNPPAQSTTTGSQVSAVTELVETTPIQSVVSMELPIELFSVEIRTANEETLVTSIEILSPVNKRSGHDAHIDYLRKRRDILRSSAHLLEIDLLRAGNRPPLEQSVPPASYYVMLSKATHRPHVKVWPIPLNAHLPVVSVPLLEPDPDIPLELGVLVKSVYDRGGYDARIDYTQPIPPPALSEHEAAWADTLLMAWLESSNASN